METFIETIKRIFVYKVNDKLNYTPALLGVGVVLLIVSWTLGFVLNEYNVSFANLIELHKASPAYFIIDLLPIILGFLGYAFTKSHQEAIQSLETQISEKDHVINMNAHFAKKIGEGDFSANDEEINDNDILGHSLKIMRENLAKTNEKEKELNWIAKGKDIISDILRLQNRAGSSCAPKDGRRFEHPQSRDNALRRCNPRDRGAQDVKATDNRPAVFRADCSKMRREVSLLYDY